MRKKTAKVISMIITLAVMMTVMTVAIPLTASAANTTYYVDATGGNDSNNGTSTGTAWQTLTKVNATTFGPGDQILFKRGGSWTGTLYPKGSGSSASRITISAYGTGNLPVINGNGKYYTAADPIDSAVYFKNQSYWTIQNLEVTNDASTAADRQGIHFDGSGTNCTDITVQNCVVRNVKSDGNSGDHGRMAGILVFSRNWWTAYKNVLIQNNEVYTTGSTGIHVNAQKAAGTATGNIIRNNYLHDIGGDGIMTLDCSAPLVEYNIVNGSHLRSTAYCVALWPFACNDALFQYNEAYGTTTTMDGQGLDADYQCNRTIFQYNYAHDNAGGFILICCEPTAWDGGAAWNNDVIVRYNIGENNAYKQFSFYNQVYNTMVYNNTIYAGTNANRMIDVGSRNGTSWINQTYFYNNIFYYYGTAGYSFGSATNTVFDYNVFYGNHPASEPADAHKLTSNPLCVNPNTGGNGLNTVDGYKLQSGSPALGSGRLVSNNGGKDFWGNTVSSSAAPNRGAYNGAGVGATTTTTTTTPAATTTTTTASGSSQLIYNFETTATQPTTYGWTTWNNPTFGTVTGFESMGKLMVASTKQDQFLYFNLPSNWANYGGRGAPVYIKMKMRLSFADNSSVKTYSFTPSGNSQIQFSSSGTTAGTCTLSSNITVRNDAWTDVLIPVTAGVLSMNYIRMGQGWMATLPQYWYIDDVSLVYNGSTTTTTTTTTTTATTAAQNPVVYNFETTATQPTTYGWTTWNSPTFATVSGFEAMGKLMVASTKQDQFLYFNLPSTWANYGGRGAPSYIKMKLRLSFADNSTAKTYSFTTSGNSQIQFSSSGTTAGTCTLSSSITVRNDAWTDVFIPVTSGVLSMNYIRMGQGWMSTLPQYWYIDDVSLVYN